MLAPLGVGKASAEGWCPILSPHFKRTDSNLESVGESESGQNLEDVSYEERFTGLSLFSLGGNSYWRTFQLFSPSGLLFFSALGRTVPSCLIIPAGKIVNYFLLWITYIPGRTGSCLIFLASYHLPTEGNVAGTCPGRSVEPAVKSLQGRDTYPFQE